MQCGERFGGAQHRNAGHGNGNKNPGGDRSGPTASQTGPPDASRPPWPPPPPGPGTLGADRPLVPVVIF